MRLLQSFNLVDCSGFRKSFLRFTFSGNFLVFLMFWLLKFTAPDLLAEEDIVPPFNLDIFEHVVIFLLLIPELRENYSKNSALKELLSFTVVNLTLVKGAYHFYNFKTYPWVEDELSVFFTIIGATIVILLISDLLIYRFFFILLKRGDDENKA